MPSNLDFLAHVIPLLLYCTVCGGMIGWERGRRGSAAGMKTQIFICVGSALFTYCALALVDSHNSADAGRVIAQIVSGVGFLGAGTIMAKDRDRIVGLTTAAIIWVMAAVGMIVGLGYGPAAVVITAGMLGMIHIITAIEKRFVPTHFERRQPVLHVTPPTSELDSQAAGKKNIG